MRLWVTACLALLLIQNDCDTNKTAAPAAPAKRITSHPTHRFALAQPLKDVALDTQTGQLCRTWDWQVIGEANKPDQSGNFPERKVGELTPTCLSLYQQYPTEGNSNDPLGILDNPN